MSDQQAEQPSVTEPAMRVENCQIEEADFRRGIYLHYSPRPVFVVLYFLIIAFILVGGVILLLEPGRTSGAIILLLVPAYVGWRLLFGIPLRARKIFRQSKLAREPFTLEIDAESVRFVASYGDSTLKWTDFHKYKVGKDLILLYQNDAFFHTFPRRWFTPEQFQEVLGFLKHALGEPKG